MKRLITVTFLYFLLASCSTDSLPDYTLTIEITPEGAGTTNPLPGGFDEGANLELEAIPAENYLFDRWEGDLTTDSNPADLTMNSDKVITAVFKREPLTLGGDGSQANPYQVHTLDDLVAIALEENLDKHYIQVADIDASASAELNNGSGFNFIGSTDHPFSGSYDGNGYTIRNLNIHFSKAFFHSGMFGYAKEALFENITIDNSEHSAAFELNSPEFNKQNIQPLAERARVHIVDDNLNNVRSGGLVGMNDGGIVRNCQFISGEVVSFGIAGGLVGVNTGSIERSGFTGRASSLRIAGGLVGVNTGRIVDSSSDGVASAFTKGGLVGYNMGGEIIHSFTTADARGGYLTGGLVGYNSGQIVSSYSNDNKILDTTGIIGGLVGQNEGTIENSYALTDFSIYIDEGGDLTSGGLVGENMSGGSITNSFSTGTFDAPDEGTTAGFIGTNEGLLVNSYWDTDSTGQNDGVGEGSPEGATGLSTAQMRGPAAAQNMPEFDWVNIWRTTEDGYPVLRWEEE